MGNLVLAHQAVVVGLPEDGTAVLLLVRPGRVGVGRAEVLVEDAPSLGLEAPAGLDLAGVDAPVGPFGQFTANVFLQFYFILWHF